MTNDYGRSSLGGEPDERHDPAAVPRPPASGVEVVQQLQRAYGNQALQRMLLQREPGTAQPQSSTITHDGKPAERTVVTKTELRAEVETVLDERFEGIRGLFLKSVLGPTSRDRARLIHSYMQGAYDLQGIELRDVLDVVTLLKEEHRDETLLYIAEHYVYSKSEPYSAENLKAEMESAGAYLEDEDDEAVEGIFDTGGKFAHTKVQIAPGTMELSDEDGIVVLMDDHQQKHQATPIPGFKTYTGGKGDKFPDFVDLAWHVATTVPVVRSTIKAAVASGEARRDRAVAPSKNAINSINYDLTISYDPPTGKWVGTYHCNPAAARFA